VQKRARSKQKRNKSQRVSWHSIFFGTGEASAVRERVEGGPIGLALAPIRSVDPVPTDMYIILRHWHFLFVFKMSMLPMA